MKLRFLNFVVVLQLLFTALAGVSSAEQPDYDVTDGISSRLAEIQSRMAEIENSGAPDLKQLHELSVKSAVLQSVLQDGDTTLRKLDLRAEGARAKRRFEDPFGLLRDLGSTLATDAKNLLDHFRGKNGSPEEETEKGVSDALKTNQDEILETEGSYLPKVGDELSLELGEDYLVRHWEEFKRKVEDHLSGAKNPSDSKVASAQPVEPKQEDIGSGAAVGDSTTAPVAPALGSAL